jgi:hypothetical protein
MRGGFLCIMHDMVWTWNASVSPHWDEPGAAESSFIRREWLEVYNIVRGLLAK